MRTAALREQSYLLARTLIELSYARIMKLEGREFVSPFDAGTLPTPPRLF